MYMLLSVSFASIQRAIAAGCWQPHCDGCSLALSAVNPDVATMFEDDTPRGKKTPVGGGDSAFLYRQGRFKKGWQALGSYALTIIGHLNCDFSIGLKAGN